MTVTTPAAVERYAAKLAEIAADLAIRVRDDDPTDVAAHIRDVLNRPAPAGVDPVVALIITLAATTPIDVPLTQLLAWTGDPDPTKPLRDAHAEYGRLRAAGQPIPQALRELDARYRADARTRRIAGHATRGVT